MTSQAVSNNLPIDILIVDDSTHMRAIIKEMLRGMGFMSVREAAGANDALIALREYPIDMVLIDISMPGMDGVELARKIRNAPESPNTYLPILVVSGYSSVTTAWRARDAGVNEFLVKPVTARGLYDRIIAMVDRPRAFLRIADYFGPDRRRKINNRYIGVERRGHIRNASIDVMT